GAGIDQELYDALADGIFDINIVRSAGDGDLYIKRSKLELEQPESLSAPEPTTVPEPATILLAGSGLAGLALSYRRKW
ncbi:MAG: PEP-CTERM sorting domain-containing protein, partial [Nitrospirota bacterium]